MSLNAKFDTTELRLSPALELKFDAGSSVDGQITGYVSVFDGVPDSYGDVVKRGAFTRSLQEHARAKSRPPLLWSHRTDVPIGRIEELHEDQRGLAMRATLNLDSENGREAHAHIKHGDVSGMSFGFRVRDRDGPMLTDVELVECSVVALPANARARVVSVKSLGSKGDFSDLLKQCGVPKRAITKLTGGGWPALTGDEDVEETAMAMLKASAARFKKGL